MNVQRPNRQTFWRGQYGWNSMFLLPMNRCGPRSNYTAEAVHVARVLHMGDCLGYEQTQPVDKLKPNGQPRRKLDVTRAREQFGFESAVPFAIGLKQTIVWYRQILATV